MNLATAVNLYCYGTSEGVSKEWDTRGRGRKLTKKDAREQLVKKLSDKKISDESKVLNSAQQAALKEDLELGKKLGVLTIRQNAAQKEQGLVSVNLTAHGAAILEAEPWRYSNVIWVHHPDYGTYHTEYSSYNVTHAGFLNDRKSGLANKIKAPYDEIQRGYADMDHKDKTVTLNMVKGQRRDLNFIPDKVKDYFKALTKKEYGKAYSVTGKLSSGDRSYGDGWIENY
jgi:hypothetical protein